MLHPGLYEQVINNALTSELAEIPEARKSVAPIDKAEASKVLAQYLADVVQKGLDKIDPLFMTIRILDCVSKSLINRRERLICQCNQAIAKGCCCRSQSFIHS